MKALVFDGQLRLEPLARRPQPAPGEALIRVLMAGICGTDLQILSGYRGYTGILGHEFVGEVVESPDPAWLGRRVCGEINLTCGTCNLCLMDRSTHCQNRSVLGIQGHPGSFAEFVTLPLSNLHSIPDEVSDEEAVFVEPLAAACQIVRQVTFEAGDRALVVGGGRLGILCAQVLRNAGAHVTVIGRQRTKMERIRKLGLQVQVAESDVAQADLVVDATGSAGGFQRALALVRPRGTLVLKSTIAGPTQVDLAQIAVNEIAVVGSRCGPFDEAIRLLAGGAVEVRPLIDRCFPLDDGVAAVQYAGRPEILKVLISMKGQTP